MWLLGHLTLPVIAAIRRVCSAGIMTPPAAPEGPSSAWIGGGNPDNSVVFPVGPGIDFNLLRQSFERSPHGGIAEAWSSQAVIIDINVLTIKSGDIYV